MTSMPIDQTADLALQDAMRQVRGRWRRRVALEGAVRALLAAMVVLAAALVILAVRGVHPGSVEVARLGVWLVLGGGIAWWIVRPLLHRVDDARLALYLDEHDPGLAQSVLSAVQDARRPAAHRLSPALSARLAATAVGALDRLGHGRAVEHPRTARAAQRLALLVGLGVAALVVLPSPWRSAARAVLMPWDASAALPVRQVAVLPGNVSVARGASLDIEATASGFAPLAAELVVQGAPGSEPLRLPMDADSLGARFALRLFDVTADATYWVESEGVRSAEFTITVTDLPAVRTMAVELRYPGYTGLDPERIDPGGDIVALVGTDATVEAEVTLPVQSGMLRFDDGATIPMSLDSAGRPVGRFRVARTGFYTVDLVTESGEVVPGTVRHLVDALPDRAPTVRIPLPGRDITPTSVEEVPVEVRADDDYGIRSLELRYTVNGGAEQRVVLLAGATAGTVEPRAVHTFFLEEWSLAPGDLVAYHAVATDGGGNEARSDLYFLEVRPYARNYRQAESGAPPAGAGEGEGEAQSPEQLSARQRELVVATFNAVRDSAGTPAARAREDRTTIALAQGTLRRDVAGLSAEMATRRVAELDSTFVLIAGALDSAGTAMATAEAALGRGALRDATGAQQAALQQLQRAEAAYRDVEVRMGQQPPGGGGGGGGGGGSTPEDLADLFEMQTDRLQNQYEAVQREASAGAAAAREVDEAQERLRELARRAQAENERARRMAEALQQRLGEQGGGGQAGGGGAAAGGAGQPGGASGGGAAQRELARQAEEEARRLERLAREQRNPALEEAARQARAAADQLRRAAAGDPTRGGDAAEALRRAGASVEAGRESAARQAVERLADRAQSLEERQREIGADAIALPPSGNAARGAALTELDRRKLELARDVQALDDALAQAEVSARRDRSGAEEGLAGARETIRDGEVPGRIAYSRNVARTGSPEYVRDFEAQIGAYLDRVESQLRDAAGAVGESPERRRERALEEARELVRAAQAMRERGQRGEGEVGEGGRQGQGEGEGEGERGEGGRQGQAQGQGRGQGQGEGEGERGEGGRQGQGQGQGDNPGREGAGGMPTGATQSGRGGDARQLAGEVRVRRQAAESLRGELAELGVNLPDLDAAITALRRLEGARPEGEPRDLANLRAAVAESLQRVEFELWRRFGMPAGSRPAVGTAGTAPEAYRRMVEEYFRQIARERR